MAAASLRGEGIEEVGEQIEHFPPAGYDGMTVNRRILVEEDEDYQATQIMEEYFDEFPELDIMGEEVEDEPEWDPDFEMEEYAGKEDQRDADMELLIDTDLFGEAVVYDQYDRREAACGENKQEFKMVLGTDKYAYETRWVLISNGQKIASGPPAGKNYADDATYSGRWCLGPGNYRLQIIDSAGDGICGGGIYGCGKVLTFLNGQSVGKNVNDRSKWRQKNFQFTVNPGSSRIDGTPVSAPGQGQWCNKVRSVMKVPQGTCTLPNGRRGHRVRVTTKVDKYGKETSWQITDRSNGGVRMKMGPVIPANQQKSVEDCLPAGRYNLKFQDLDGVCCRHGQGFFKLIVNGQQLLDGGAFQKSIDHDFQLGLDWISTMSERDCEWWWAHDYRRRDWHTRCYQGKYCNKTYRHLKWSEALKADAQVYANKLLSTCDDTGIKHDATDQGENLAKNKGSGKWGQQYSADLVTKRFVDNEEFWGWNRNAHLTQAMWYPSRYIGCAESSKNMGGNKMCRMQVCRYAKAGNCMMGAYNSDQGNNWMIPMMMDDSPCGPMCPPRQGCFH